MEGEIMDTVEQENLSASPLFIASITTLFTLLIGYISLTLDRHTSENSLLEWSQQLLVFISCLLCFRVATSASPLRDVGLLLSAFFLVVFIRELDYQLERVLPHGSWKYPVWLVVSVSALFYYKNRNQVSGQLRLLTESCGFTSLLTGFLLVFLFSRLLGYTGLWQFIMQDTYQRDVKNLAEEGLELLGYSHMFIGITMFWREQKPQLHSRLPNPEH